MRKMRFFLVLKLATCRITDIASIEYRDESRLLAQAADPERCYIEQVMPAKLALAARYVRTRSLWLDLRLIGRTLAALLH